MIIRRRIILILLITFSVIVTSCNKHAPPNNTNPFSESSISAEKAQSPEHVVGNKKGNKAIEFSVKNVDGKTVNLSDYTNSKKPLLLYFWATWCPFCERDFAIVKNIYPQYKEDVSFLSIDIDMQETAEIIKEYANTRGLNEIEFAVGEPKILTDYSIRSTTTKFAISKEGVILWTGSGVVDENTWKIIFEGLKNS